MSELLNCPLCGNKAVMFENGDNSPNWGVQCDDWRCCGIDGYRTEAKAANAWNQRQPIPESVREDIEHIVNDYYQRNRQWQTPSERIGRVRAWLNATPAAPQEIVEDRHE